MTGYFTTQGHDRLRREVADFAERHVRPRIPEMEASRSAHHELSRLIARQGWIGVTIGREYGGMSMGHLAKTIVIEELSRVSGAMGAMAQASQLGTAKILHFGSDAQKKAWLPAIAAGDVLPTIAVTEPQSGSHVLGMEMTAEPAGGSYVLNGRKIHVGNSHVADLHGVVAKTGGRGSRSLSAFLVEADRPGVVLVPQRPALGLHGFSFGEIEFDNVRVPAVNMLGEAGDGLAIAYSSSVTYGRPNLTAVALGIHRATVEDTIAYANACTRYGKPLAELPAVRLKLGELQSRLMTSRAAAYLAAHMLDQGTSCDAELMNAKLVNVRLALDSARIAMEVFAAAGLFTDQPIERYLRDAHLVSAPAGTPEIQLLRLAESALGTAREQWSGRLSAALAEASRGLRESSPDE